MTARMWTDRISHAVADFFLRQMTELVRAGKIYIAQPPLYQISARKREEYVEDDVAVKQNFDLVRRRDVRLKILADKKEITALN